MNEFESDWISLSQSQSGGRVFLSESQRWKQGVWIQDGSIWIQHSRIQDGYHHQVEWEWMSLSQIELVWVRVRSGGRVFLSESERWKTRCLNPTWQNSRWLPSSSWVRMNEFESDWISLSQSQEWRERVFEVTWEKITRCLNPTWQNSRWLPSSSWVRMNEFWVRLN